MNDQGSPTNSNERTPVDTWRRWLANQVVASYGMGMWVLFIAPLGPFLVALSEQDKIAAIVAGSLWVAGFFGTLLFAPRFLAVSHLKTGPRTVLSHSLRRFRSFVGNGEMIQGIAGRIDPNWRNPYSGRTPGKTASWLLFVELIHWAALIASIPPIVAGFWYSYQLFSCVYAAANLVYNVLPILVIRDTRRRVSRISQRMNIGRHNAVDGGKSAVAADEHVT